MVSFFKSNIGFQGLGPTYELKAKIQKIFYSDTKYFDEWR